MSQPHVRFDFADALRGLAMLAVVLFHYTQIFWFSRVRVGQILDLAPLAGYPGASLALPVNLGAVGVGLFLLLSGLLIPLSLGRQGAARFAVTRLTRIYPTYWAGLAVTVLALWLASRLGGTAFAVSGRDVLGHASIAFQDMLGGRNIDPVMWTLKVELWFYALLGAAFALTRRRLKGAIWLLLPILALLCRGPAWGTAWHAAQYYLAPVVCYFPLMFAGSWCYFWLTGQASRRETAIMATLMLALFVWFTGWHSLALYLSYAVGIVLFALGVLRPAWWRSRLLARVGAVSYAWYVCHSIAGYVTMTALARLGLPWWLLVLAALFVTWWRAVAINRWVELPTQRWGKRLAERL